MKRIAFVLLCTFLAISSFAQQGELTDTVYKEFVFPITDADVNKPFFYFNNEWIPGANIDIVSPEQITALSIKDDEYGNRSVFITVDQATFDQIKQDANAVFINTDPRCEFPGGNGKLIGWIAENIRVPANLKNPVKVLVGLKIMPNGEVVEAKIIKPSNNVEANQEALRLANSLPKFRVQYFTPKKTPVFYGLPITFTPAGFIYIR